MFPDGGSETNSYYMKKADGTAFYKETEHGQKHSPCKSSFGKQWMEDKDGTRDPTVKDCPMDKTTRKLFQ